MHLIDMPHGVLGTSAVVGTTIPLAVGYALALKRQRKTDRWSSRFSATARPRKASSPRASISPLCRGCRSCSSARTTVLRDSHAGARALGDAALVRACRDLWHPDARIEDGDVVEVARDRVPRRCATPRRGPAFIECLTYRWREHVGPNEDFDAGYRGAAELEPGSRAIRSSIGSDCCRSADPRIDARRRCRDRRRRSPSPRPARSPTRALLTNVFAAPP